MNDWEGIQEIINEIPDGDFKSYQQMTLNKYQSGGNFDTFTSDEMDLITSLANEESYSGILASNLNAYLTKTWYDEEIPVAEVSQQKQANYKPEHKVVLLPKLYPNPANAEFFFLIPEDYENEDAVLIVYDVFGKKKINMQAATFNFEIAVNIQSLSQGVYYCELISNGEVISKDKLVVLR